MCKYLKINVPLLKHTDREQRAKALEPGGPDCQLSLHSLLLGTLGKVRFPLYFGFLIHMILPSYMLLALK